MAYLFHVSLQNTDKILVEWIRKLQQDNEISPSLVFRDAMLERKKEWDTINSEDPTELKKTIERHKETLTKFNNFIASNKTIQEEWFNFNGIEGEKK